ncbi:MAG TPA: cob(I)yrinic acid a,c-diamide adenosyltransferase [Candidatus Poseidoniales archaeon]|nr:cob(I)yrinic acid a,c-diamide adenosyltransferase [Candidatus Poseidoniales archaeon]
MDGAHRVTTGTGDDGTTGLVDGSRTTKDSQRIEMIGLLDEVNASLGMVRAGIDNMRPTHVDGGPRHTVQLVRRLEATLTDIQSDLFDLGAEVAIPDGKSVEGIDLLGSDRTESLLKHMDQLSKDLTPLTTFILPGAPDLAARLHVARTVIRRAERNAVATEGLRDDVVIYLNRLSDWCFVASRWVTSTLGFDETEWVALAKRDTRRPRDDS